MHQRVCPDADLHFRLHYSKVPSDCQAFSFDSTNIYAHSTRNKERNRTVSRVRCIRHKNNSGLFIILALAAAAGIGGYYYKVILLKKELEQADDLDDFDFEDEDTETVVNEDEETDE